MTIAYVQGTGITGSGTSLSKAFVSNVTGGNFIAVAISVYNAVFANAITSVTDNLGNTYVLDVSKSSFGPTLSMGIYRALNITGGACTVTVNCNGAQYLTFGIAEFSGVATVSALDVTNSANGTSTTPSVGLTTTDTDVILGVESQNATGSITEGSGYSLIYEYETNANTTISFIYRIAASGSYTPNWTLAASQTWGCAAAAYKVAAGGGGAKFPTPHLWWSEA